MSKGFSTLQQVYENSIQSQTANKRNKSAPSNLKQAYNIILEKTALYSKEYPNDLEEPPEENGFKTLGFVENPQKIQDIVQGVALRPALFDLFKNGGWNQNSKTTIRDFDISFLTPLSQKMAQSKITNTSVREIIFNKKNLHHTEKQIESQQPFNLFASIKQDLPNLTDELLELCYSRSGKTTNDVGFGDAEVLFTLFTNASKGESEGDLFFPNIQKVEVKASGGRIGKPQTGDTSFKDNIIRFLKSINKFGTSTSKQQTDSEIEKISDELKLITDSEDYKKTFSSLLTNFLIDFSTSLKGKDIRKDKKLKYINFRERFFPYKLFIKSNNPQKNAEGIFKLFQNENFIVKDFLFDENRELFITTYNKLKTTIDKLRITTTLKAVDVFTQKGGTFIDNFFRQDFGLTIEETAEALTLCEQHITDVNKVKQSIIEFLSKDNHFTLLKTLPSNSNFVLKSIIFALQVCGYSFKESFDYILIVNKHNKNCLGLNCAQSADLFQNLLDRFLSLYKDNKININVQIDFRGGSAVTLH